MANKKYSVLAVLRVLEDYSDEEHSLYIKEIQGLRRYDPPYTNWLLFVAMEESFLIKVGLFFLFQIKYVPCLVNHLGKG